MRAPLENEAGVPKSEDGKKNASSGESGAAGAKESSGAFEQNGEAENKKRSERNEKAVAVRRNARPIGITGDEKIKGEKGGKKRSAGAALPSPKEKEADDREEKNRRPGEEPVIGREEHGEKDGRAPRPVLERNVAGLERIAVNEITSDESGKKADENDNGEERMAEEELREARGGIGCDGSTGAQGEIILARGFDGQDGEDHGVGVVNVEHEASDCGENQPLRERARGTRLMPIPEKKRHSESGMRVGPGGIEIHINRERASPPNRERGEKRPAVFDILARESKGDKQTEKSVKSGGESHGDTIRSGETVGGDGRTQGAGEENAGVRNEQKGSPENRRTDGEVIIEMAGGSSKAGFGLVIFIEARAAEAFVGVAVILGEVEIVLEERSAGKSVVADAIAAHPGIQKRKREKKEKKKQALRFAREVRGQCAEVWLVHEGGPRRNAFLYAAAIITGQHHDVELISQVHGRDLVTVNYRGGIVP